MPLVLFDDGLRLWAGRFDFYLRHFHRCFLVLDSNLWTFSQQYDTHSAKPQS